VVLGSGHGQPWLGYATAWPQKALNSFVSMQPFAIDHSRTAHLLTTCPLGFLQRIGPIASGDERLDAA
jgi:cephalosporin hydroxylase